MKSTINISISGIAFTLETDAYDTLNNYMKQVEKAYKSDIAANEIISDIESRISELVLSWQNEHATIVTKECIDHIITQLGIPEDQNSDQPTTDYTPEDEKQPITRRLYRNAQGARLGGVLNGIAAYSNIDVTLLRIVVFAIFTICLFVGHTQIFSIPMILISYIALWMIIPVARNARQKMEMYGQPITAETISTTIKDELNSISPNEKNEKTASIFTNLVYSIGKVIRFIFMFIAVTIGIAVFVSIIVAIGAGCFLLFKGSDALSLILDTNTTWSVILAMVCALAPLVFIMYAIIKMFLSLKWNKAILISLFSLWIVSWGVGAFVAGINVLNFASRTSTNNIKRHQLQSDTLTILPTGNADADYCDYVSIKEHIDFNVIENKELSKSEVKINIRRESSGRTHSNAMENCNDINFSYTIVNDTLSFPCVIPFRVPEKYRGQGIDMDIEVAPGTTIIIPENYYNKHRWDIFEDCEVESQNLDGYIKIKSTELQQNTVIDSTEVKSQETEVESQKDGENSQKTILSITTDSTNIEVVSIKNGKVVTTKK